MKTRIDRKRWRKLREKRLRKERIEMWRTGQRVMKEGRERWRIVTKKAEAIVET